MKNSYMTQRYNFIWLLMALMLLFFLSALSAQLGSKLLAEVIGPLLALTILISVWSLERPLGKEVSRKAVAAVLVVLLAVEYLLHSYNLAVLELSFLLFFLMSTIYVSCRQVLFSGHVDRNKIIGAICIYMLLALAWAIAYLLVEQIFPGSIPAFEDTGWRDNTQSAIYFSFISITSTGYGDFLPLQPMARYLAYLQAFAGQFYMAVLVASLIGVRLAGRGQEE